MSHEEIRMMNGQLKIIVTITIISVLMLAASALAQPCGGYEVTAIIQTDECPPFGFPGMVPDGMNDLGWVVGHFNACVIGPDVSWLWTPESGLELLDMPPNSSQSRAIDINNHPDRQIVGTVDISDVGTRAFLIDGEDLILIEPPNNGTFSSVSALNNQRQVVGSTADGTPFSKAYIWEDGAMTIIEPTFGPRSAARDINEAGVVVGWMGTGIGIDSHAFVRQKNGRIQDLGPIPGGLSGNATAINAQIQITVGGSFGDDHPQGFISGGFLWEADRWTDLGMLEGYDSMAVKGLNSGGTIVGWSRAIDISNLPDTGFIWNEGVMTNLNDLLPIRSQLHIQRVEAINDSGQITAQAVNADNDVVAVLLTPIFGPMGDLSGDCAVSVADLLILLASWGICDVCNNCPADFNGDCIISTLDLLILFSNWG